MKCCYVELVRMKLGVLNVEPVDEECKLFSSMKTAEAWLLDNGFVYGQRSFFNYPTGDKEWFHVDDIGIEYIDVFIMEMNVDDLTDSKFKNLGEIHRQWLPDFFKKLEENEQEEERIKGKV